MRYLGLLAAVVVIACVFAYVTRTPSTGSQTNGLASSENYGTTVDAVRTTIRNAGGAEQRRKWAVTQQMRSYGSNNAGFGAEGENADTLVVRSESMDITYCSAFSKGDDAAAAASIGFTSLSCRTTANGVISEIPLP